MSGLYWHSGVHVQDYTAAVKGERTVLTVRLAVTDPHELGQLLHQLAEIKREQEPKPAARKSPLLLEHKPMRRL